MTAAFVCIGLEFAFAELGRVGWKPIGVYGLATVVNMALALLAAYLLFGR